MCPEKAFPVLGIIPTEFSLYNDWTIGESRVDSGRWQVIFLTAPGPTPSPAERAVVVVRMLLCGPQCRTALMLHVISEDYN